MAREQHLRPECAEALELILHGQRIGILVHCSGGRNVLTFDPEYRRMPTQERPVFTLTQLWKDDYLTSRQNHSHRLPPVLSNLLPEGALREWLSSILKTHMENEFPLLVWTGGNLPGALEAKPLGAGETPDWALTDRDQVEPIQIDVSVKDSKFSLAGVQMKFSSVRQDGRFNISTRIGADSWIVKTPSTVHRNVPENEFTAMKLAESMGVDIPEIELIPLEQLENLPDETVAYGIRHTAYDVLIVVRRGLHRTGSAFTQKTLPRYLSFTHANYEQIGRVIYQFSQRGLADLQQMARRLLANILMANGDAHLKNWSMIYPDRIQPRLTPAYDIVTTLPYVQGETGSALNMGKEKAWKNITLSTFQYWTTRIGAPWPAIKIHLEETIEVAREQWSEKIQVLPMSASHKAVLKEHLAELSPDFRVEL